MRYGSILLRITSTFDSAYAVRLPTGCVVGKYRSAQHSTVEALKHTHVPVILVHGADDHFVPVEMTYENYTACTAPKDLLIVPGADHGMSYFMEPEKYENAVKAFWAKYDRPRCEA